jgi:hypothetical protein
MYIYLALEAETAVPLLPIADREYYRKEVSDHLKSLKFQEKANHQHPTQSEFKTTKSILQTLKHQNSLPYQ